MEVRAGLGFSFAVLLALVSADQPPTAPAHGARAGFLFSRLKSSALIERMRRKATKKIFAPHALKKPGKRKKVTGKPILPEGWVTREEFKKLPTDKLREILLEQSKQLAELRKIAEAALRGEVI